VLQLRARSDKDLELSSEEQSFSLPLSIAEKAQVRLLP